VGSSRRRRTQVPRPIVFVIDDDPSIRRAIGRLLHSSGYAAELFASAEEFLAYERPPRPACLVLDLWLPGMRGLELQARLAESGDPLPVVVITGHADKTFGLMALASGARAVLDKPFDDEDLLAEVRSALSQGKDGETAR
jgi:FixJ family two-component response regulator